MASVLHSLWCPLPVLWSWVGVVLAITAYSTHLHCTQPQNLGLGQRQEEEEALV